MIGDIFSTPSETEVVRHLSGDNAQLFVDVIDEVFPHHSLHRMGLLKQICSSMLLQMLDELGPHLRRECLRTLCKICGDKALLPRSVQIPLCYNPADPPLYHGGYSEVWKGQHKGCEVAVKVLKVYQTSNFDKIRHVSCKYGYAKFWLWN